MMKLEDVQGNSLLQKFLPCPCLLCEVNLHTQRFIRYPEHYEYWIPAGQTEAGVGSQMPQSRERTMCKISTQPIVSNTY